MTREVKFRPMRRRFLTSRVMDSGASGRDVLSTPGDRSPSLLAFPASLEDTMFDAQRLADRYVAAWNEESVDRRRAAISALWAPERRHEAGSCPAPGFGALGRLIAASRDVRAGSPGLSFRAAPSAQQRRDVVTFRWEMTVGDGDVLASGIEFLVVDEEGRILSDHPFVPA
jgi:hypothetical protein